MSEFNRDPIYIKAIGIKGIREINKDYACVPVNGTMCLQKVTGDEPVTIYKFEKSDLHFSMFDLVDKILDQTDVLGFITSGKIDPELWKDEKISKLLLDGFMVDRGHYLKQKTKESYDANGKKWDRFTSVAYDNEVKYEYYMIQTQIEKYAKKEGKTK